MSNDKTIYKSPVTGRNYTSLRGMEQMDRQHRERMAENLKNLDKYKDSGLTCICRNSQFIIPPSKEKGIICTGCGMEWDIHLLRDKYVKESLSSDFIQFEEYVAGGKYSAGAGNTPQASKDAKFIKSGIKTWLDK